MDNIPWFLATIGVVSGLYWWIAWEKQCAKTDKIISYWKESHDFNVKQSEEWMKLLSDFSGAVTGVGKSVADIIETSEVRDALEEAIEIHKMRIDPHSDGSFICRIDSNAHHYASESRAPALVKYLKAKKEKSDDPK